MMCPKCESEMEYAIGKKGTIAEGIEEWYCPNCGYIDGEELQTGEGEDVILIATEHGKPFEGCTCNDCDSAKDGSCEYAYDRYNTDGDCLAVK
jgi:Zn-finger nucleic acid-binding protein